ncbi:hypothetical protein [Sphingopyxis sp. 2PD]|nr:hypothetical protein [Sphingopyxis sp. 2PD]
MTGHRLRSLQRRAGLAHQLERIETGEAERKAGGELDRNRRAGQDETGP